MGNTVFIPAATVAEQIKPALGRIQGHITAGSLKRPRIHSGQKGPARNIGAEWEVPLVHVRTGLPAWGTNGTIIGGVAEEAWRSTDPVSLQMELGSNLVEANFRPRPLELGTFTGMRAEMEGILGLLNRSCGHHGLAVVSTGILPTLATGKLNEGNFSAKPRYAVLTNALEQYLGARIRSGTIECGGEELPIGWCVATEIANTSIQFHEEVA
ncbi:MAG: hypothetical protein KDD44_05600, partial [Bdellovibrionales bacterium]|nr:hypothetical protein [Bdellovibrionales bacterium]